MQGIPFKSVGTRLGQPNPGICYVRCCTFSISVVMFHPQDSDETFVRRAFPREASNLGGGGGKLFYYPQYEGRVYFSTGDRTCIPVGAMYMTRVFNRGGRGELTSPPAGEDYWSFFVFCKIPVADRFLNESLEVHESAMQDREMRETVMVHHQELFNPLALGEFFGACHVCVCVCV